jgi:outer membrane protein assembly factor BamD (BamD/ComL family)
MVPATTVGKRKPTISGEADGEPVACGPCWPLPLSRAAASQFKLIPAVVLAALLTACSSSESDWNKTLAVGSPAAYQTFLAQHPDSQHAREARELLQKMADDQAWSNAQQSNTIEAYRQYLQERPAGAFRQDARTQVMLLERAAAWKAAEASNTEAAFQDFLQKYGAGPEAALARVQLQKLHSDKARAAGN